MFAKDQFMKQLFKEKTYMCVVNKQDAQFPGSHWVMVSRPEKGLFYRLSWKRLYPLSLQDQETRLPSIQKITMFRLKIMWSLSCVFGYRLSRGLDVNSVMDYHTWDCRLNDDFIYDCIKEKL